MKEGANAGGLKSKQTRDIRIVCKFLPDIDLQPIRHQKLYSVHMTAQVQRCISLIICGQQIGPELVQEATYFHVAAGGG